MSLLPKSIHRCRRYPTKFNSGRDIPDFIKYQTYTWHENPSDDVADATDRIIVDHIDSVMSLNGIFRDDYEPDLFITYYGSAEESFGIGGGYRSDWTSSGAITIDSHRAGTLVVDIVDVDENQVVWSGIATATIQREARKNRQSFRTP